MTEIDLRASAEPKGTERPPDVDDVIDPRAPQLLGMLAGEGLLQPPGIAAASPEPPFDRDQALLALRAPPFGGSDDASLALRLPPPVQAGVSPIITAVRWGAVLYAMVAAVTRANQGDLEVVAALAVVLFLTTWRTLRPIRLGSPQVWRRLLALLDAAVVGLAVGWSGALNSPFVFCVVATAVVATFGWGLGTGLVSAGVGLAAAATAAAASNDAFQPGQGQGPMLLTSLVLVVAMVAFARTRLLEAENKRASLAGQLDLLTETNDLLHILNELARTLPQSLDLREAMAAARTELRHTFDADVIALVTLDDHSEEWVPQIADGCALRPALHDLELPVPLRLASEASTALLHARFEPGQGLGPRSASGLYVAVRARGRTIGLLGVEHRNPGQYSARHARLLAGLSDVLALTVDNARSFSRLRSLGAEEERSRIARDLHDRLGQWLSYISFELERIIDAADDSNEELERLHRDVQTAIDELRETLRQLRAEVTEDREFAAVAAELVQRFNQRGGGRAGATEAKLSVVHPGRRLGVRVETELLRILQEALSNVAKHAGATTVGVRWEVGNGAGTLVIRDDGRGFNPGHAIRDSAYGLVGMRERADVIGARLQVSSRPGQGTTITVRAGGARDDTVRAGRARDDTARAGRAREDDST